MTVHLTGAHWIYALMTLIIICTMLFRKGVVVPTLVGTLLVAWVYNGTVGPGFIKGLQAVFNANLVAAKELFSIFLIITFMGALLRSLKDLGSDQMIIRPIEKLMTNGHVAYLVLIVITYVISLFFWPTPAVPLIGALLIPAAIRAGLPAMGAAIAVSIAGQGMALSSDYVMQIAPTISAKAAGVDKALVADRGMVLSLIVGAVAIVLAYLSLRKSMRRSGDVETERELAVLEGLHGGANEAAAATELSHTSVRQWGKVFAVVVPVSLLLVVAYMVYKKFSTGSGSMTGFEGGDGAAFIGGVAAVLLILSSFAFGRGKAWDNIADHFVSGFVFAFKAMGPVIPIAGFFFLGSSDFSGAILSLGDKAAHPGFLFELVQSVQNSIPHNTFISAFVILIVGIIGGLDGSGFAPLPLTGGLSGAIAPTIGADPATLAAVGQMGAIWSGGGTIVAWSSLVAVAGFCGVSVIELVRKNFVPVIVGLVVATIVAVIIW